MDADVRVQDRPAARGAGWLRDAFTLFRDAPAVWISLCVGWIVLWFMMLLVPFIGPVVANLLQPVFFASFAIAAYRQSRREPIGIQDLFAGFRHHLKALVNLGFVMLLVQLGSVFLMRVLGLPSWPADQPFDLVEYAEMLREAKWVLFAGFSLMAVASGALWFAPQLVAFHGMPASHAIRWSVYAALSNVGAMSVYGGVLVVLLFVAWVPFGVGLIVMLPVMVISTYTGYRDVFEDVTPPLPPTGGGA